MYTSFWWAHLWNLWWRPHQWATAIHATMQISAAMFWNGNTVRFMRKAINPDIWNCAGTIYCVFSTLQKQQFTPISRLSIILRVISRSLCSSSQGFCSDQPIAVFEQSKTSVFDQSISVFQQSKNFCLISRSLFQHSKAFVLISRSLCLRSLRLLWLISRSLCFSSLRLFVWSAHNCVWAV
jgi:hypothetical protein